MQNNFPYISTKPDCPECKTPLKDKDKPKTRDDYVEEILNVLDGVPISEGESILKAILKKIKSYPIIGSKPIIDANPISGDYIYCSSTKKSSFIQS